MPLLNLTVAAATPETELIRRVVLAPETGMLPGFEPGSYITVHIPGVGRRRYSLVNAQARAEATRAPSAYVLGVRLDANGGGGSRWIHALNVGDRVEVDPPENDFPLTPGDGPVWLVAGGIGVTPLISKAAAMRAVGRPFRFLYAARRRADLAFLAEVQALAGDGLVLHLDDEAGGVLDMTALIDSVPEGMAVHVCGPQPMLSAAIRETRRLGWPAGRLRFERFFSLGEVPGAASAPQPTPAPAPPAPPAAPESAPEPAAAPDGSFEVEVASTGQVFTVPPDKTILAVLLDAGLDPLHDCLKGECGVCQVGVIAGTPDHRDSILSESERAAGKLIQICVSRSKSPRLTLDL
jgi:vanillate O-demethylase ferredoxin subunit